MKKLVFLTLSLMLVAPAIILAQNCDNAYWGTKTIYEPQQSKYTPAPTGYKPVFINYVGRHGARHLTKDVNTTLAYAMLFKADSAKALTADGQKLKAMVIVLQKIEQPALKSISVRGVEEQYGIGERMRQNNPNVFNDAKYCVNVTITKEERTKQSSEAFLKGLAYDPTKSVCTASTKVDNDILRFFSIAPAYAEFEEKGSWKQQMDKLEKAVKPIDFDVKFLTRFFQKGFIGRLSADEQDELIDDVFGFSSVTNSIQTEITKAGYKKADLDFRSLITCEQLRVLDMLNSADDFLKKSPGMDINGIQVRDAVPLLVSFINTTDNYLAHKNVAAELRFTHAEAVAPIAALLDLNGASTPATDILKFNKVWDVAKVIPLSANIQMILLNSGSDNYLVKFMLGEKEVSINGLPTKTFPFYNWKTVRGFYLRKLNKLNVNLADDMHAYLMNLK